MSDEPKLTSIPETARTAAQVGADAASQYLNSRANSLKNKSSNYLQENPRQTVLIALVVGMVLGRAALR